MNDKEKSLVWRLNEFIESRTRKLDDYYWKLPEERRTGVYIANHYYNKGLLEVKDFLKKQLNEHNTKKR